MSESKRKKKAFSGPVIVVEAGADQLKLVQINHSGNTPEVAAVYVRKFDGAAVSLIGGLSGAFDKLKLPSCPVIACLPRQAVTVRFLEVPSTEPDEIADMVELQIDKQTPYSREELVVDYRILAPGDSGYTRVMLVLVQKAQISQRFRLLTEAGLEPGSMSISTEGTMAWYRNAYSAKTSETVALADVDRSSTDFSVISRGEMVFSRNISVGSARLDEDGDQWTGKLVQEIDHALEAYAGEIQGAVTPGTVMLAGAGPSVAGLDTLLKTQLKVEVRAARTMQNIAKKSGVADLTQGDFRGSSFTALIGMGLSPDSLESNFVPEPVQLRRNLETKAKRLTASGVLLMSVLACAAAASMGRLQERVAYYERLLPYLDETEAAANEVVKKDEICKEVERRLDSRRSAINVLLEIHALTPKEVYYDSIVIEDDRVLLKGRAQGYRNVDMLRRSLEESDVIAGQVKSGKERIDPTDRRVLFEMECSPHVPGAEE